MFFECVSGVPLASEDAVGDQGIKIIFSFRILSEPVFGLDACDNGFGNLLGAAVFYDPLFQVSFFFVKSANRFTLDQFYNMPAVAWCKYRLGEVANIFEGGNAGNKFRHQPVNPTFWKYTTLGG